MSWGHVSFILTCDSCGYVEDFSTGNYDAKDTVAQLQKEVFPAAWREKEGRHYCDECVAQGGIYGPQEN